MTIPPGVYIIEFNYFNKHYPMAKIGPSTLSDRLHRIEGQVRGVDNLIVNNEVPEKILIQVQAIISSLESLSFSNRDRIKANEETP